MGREQVEHMLSCHGAVRPGRDPALRAATRAMVGRGELAAVLPGVFAEPHPGWRLRAAAAAVWDPDCVVAGDAAAALTYWPERAVAEVLVLTDRRGGHHGYRMERRTVDPEWILEERGLRCTAPAMTAIELAVETEGDSIDRVLRSRMAHLEHLEAAFAAAPKRIGNPHRRRLLLDSRAEPWSAAERLGHRLLRTAGIRGWSANRPVRVKVADATCTFFPDLVFGAERVLVEIDGQIHRTDHSVFVQDRRRQNLLQLDGWFVLRFTWDDLRDFPDVFVRQVGQALRQRSRPPVRTSRR